MNACHVESSHNQSKRNHQGVLINQTVSPIKETPAPPSSTTISLRNDISFSSTSTASEFFSTILKNNLKKIDPSESLCIHKYVYYCAKDKLFCDKLQNIGFVPQIPSPQEIKNTKDIICDHQLTAQCKSDCISLLMSYFQNSYFINNMENAVINKVSLVNVTAPVYQPCFTFSPEVGLETLTKIKQSCSVSLQAAACENAIFIKQILLIMATHLIFRELYPKYKNKGDLQKEVQCHLHLLYVKAKMEFFNEFNPKSFDWSNMPNKIKHLQSKWRKENKEPPQVAFNRHSQKIINRIMDGTKSFAPDMIEKEYTQFLEDGEKLAESFKRRKLDLVDKSATVPSSNAATTATLTTVTQSSSQPPPPQQTRNGSIRGVRAGGRGGGMGFGGGGGDVGFSGRGGGRGVGFGRGGEVSLGGRGGGVTHGSRAGGGYGGRSTGGYGARGAGGYGARGAGGYGARGGSQPDAKGGGRRSFGLPRNKKGGGTQDAEGNRKPTNSRFPSTSSFSTLAEEIA